MAKRKKKRRQPAARRKPMTPFYRCTSLQGIDGTDVPLDPDAVYLRNNIYQIDLRLIEPTEPFGRIAWISIKRTDRAPIHDWRDLQQIKNLVVGKEVEAVEVYPAESRLVDTSNQYHLWAFIDGYTLPFGYVERLVMVPDNPDGSNNGSRSRQRPWLKGEQPDDALTTEEAFEKYSADEQFGERRQGDSDAG